MQLAHTIPIAIKADVYIAQPAVMGISVIPPAINDHRAKADAAVFINHRGFINPQ